MLSKNSAFSSFFFFFEVQGDLGSLLPGALVGQTSPLAGEAALPPDVAGAEA